MSKLSTFTTPKGEQKQLRYYIDGVAFLDRFGKDYLQAIGEVSAAINAIARIKGTNKRGVEECVVKFFPVPQSQDADIFITMGIVDEVGDQDVYVEDIVGTTLFRTHDGTKKPYAQIVMDEAQSWGLGKIPWWRRIFGKNGPRLQRWVIHEWLHAVGVGHTHPGGFRSLMDEENWTDQSPVIPEYDEAALCLAHGFSHPFQRNL